MQSARAHSEKERKEKETNNDISITSNGILNYREIQIQAQKKRHGRERRHTRTQSGAPIGSQLPLRARVLEKKNL